jgi:histidine ammonia-lyase
VSLKIAALGQGLSGVRWKLVQGLADCLTHDLLPAIQARQVSDRLALSHLFALITGTGETLGDNRRRAAAKGLKKAGLFPLKLSAPEKQALLSGTELSTAFALAGLFEAERVFQSALVAGALSADAAPPAGGLAPSPGAPAQPSAWAERSGASAPRLAWRPPRRSRGSRR